MHASSPFAWLLALALPAAHGCSHVAPYERERLANPAMRFEMDPTSDAQRLSVHEITEGDTFASAGRGNAGAGCGRPQRVPRAAEPAARA